MDEKVYKCKKCDGIFNSKLEFKKHKQKEKADKKHRKWVKHSEDYENIVRTEM